VTAHPTTGIGQAELNAARLLLSRKGITPADLLAGAAHRPTAPTFAEYVPVVSGAVSDASRRAYGAYWNKVPGDCSAVVSVHAE
jgi:integrase/recombinase XerC